MRLYKRHDIDLLCIYKQKGYSLQHTIKQAVLAYLNNEDVKIDYPDCCSAVAVLPSTAQFHLYLSNTDEDDIKIQECIAKIPKGFKNSFLKNITRYYISTPDAFCISDDKVLVQTKKHL